MSKERNPHSATAVIHRRSRAEPPQFAQTIAEIRTDATIPVQPGKPPQHALGPLVIEWTYRVPWAKIAQFNQWLAQNEPFIANSCAATMPGVNYLGTYMAIDGSDVHYKTIWSYDSLADIDKWKNALK